MGPEYGAAKAEARKRGVAHRACVHFYSFVARSLVYLEMNQNVNFNFELNPNEICGSVGLMWLWQQHST